MAIYPQGLQVTKQRLELADGLVASTLMAQGLSLTNPGIKLHPFPELAYRYDLRSKR